MAKVNNIKRLIAEDFEEEYQDLVRQLSFVINPLSEQITSAFNKNIDFDNLNQEVAIVEASVNGAGVPKVELQIKVNLKTRLKGVHVINIENLTDNSLLTGAPFVNYQLITNGLKVNQITGLVADKKYRLTLVLIG